MTRRALSPGLSAGLLLFAACARELTPSPAPPPRPAPPPPSLLEDLAAARSTATPLPPPPPRDEPLPEPAPQKIAAPLKTAGAKQAVLDLRPYCQPAVSRAGGAETVGCACCPPFELCAPSPGAKLVESETVYPLRARVDGAFTGPGEHEAALVFDGCESHAENYGGTLLVDLTDPAQGKPRAPDYRPGVHPTRCKTLRTPRATDAILCEYPDSHQGDQSDLVFVYDFTKKDAEGFTGVYAAVDDTLVACSSGGVGSPVFAQHIEDFEARDTNGDGVSDIVVHVVAQRGKVTKPYLDVCKRGLESDDPAVLSKLPPLASFLGPPEHRTLTFLGKRDGTFAATPETTMALKVMNLGARP